MSHEDIAIIREFPDRSIKWLLETPENVRGLLLVVARDIAEHLDFTRVRRLPRSFIPDDLRKREADLIFLVPFLEREGEIEREVIIYVLIEHQSTPDPMMSFRVLFYMVQIWESQRREWEDRNVPLSQRRFRAILPVVFYTGAQRWESLLDMKSLIDLPGSLERFVPCHETLFFNLKSSEPESLVASGHPFGWVLRVMQKEEASFEEIREALVVAVRHLEGMSDEERAIWEKLIRFLLLLIYHRRVPSERGDLLELLETSVKDKSRREEVERMGKTIAQALIEEGKEIGKELGIKEGKELGIREGKELGLVQAKQEALMKLLQNKFGDSARDIIERVKTIQDINELDTLFDRALTSKTLDELQDI